MTGAREHAFACAFLCLVLALAFGDSLLPGRSPTMAHEIGRIDHAFIGEPTRPPLEPPVPAPIRPNDPAPMWFAYPMDVLATRQFHAGEWPTWNPYNGFGAPHLAAGETAPFFPLKLLFYLAPAAPEATMAAYGWFLVARLLIAGIGTYAFARFIGTGLIGALIAAQGYMLCGFLLTDFQHVDSTPVTLLPLVLWTVEAHFRRMSGATAACGLALGITVLSGHPETALFVALAAGLYGLVGIVSLARIEPRAASAACHRLLGSAALGLGVSLVGVLPLVELMRTRASYVSAGSQLTHPLGVAMEQYWALIAGYVLWPLPADGHPLQPNVYFRIVNAFSGPLAVWGLSMRFAGAAPRLPAPLWTVAAVAGLAALLLPPVALVPSPLRIQSYYATPLLCFTLAMLAGWVVDRVQRHAFDRIPRRRVAEATAATILVYAAVVHPALAVVVVAFVLAWLWRSPLVVRALAWSGRALSRRETILTSPTTTRAGVAAIVAGLVLAITPALALSAPAVSRVVRGSAAMALRHLSGQTGAPDSPHTAFAIAALWGGVVGCVLFVPRLSAGRWRRALGWLAVVITAIGTVTVARRIAPSAVAFSYPTAPFIAYLAEDTRAYRVASLDADVLRGNTATIYGVHALRLSYVFHSCRYRLFVGAINGADPRVPCVGEQFGNNVSAQRVHDALLPAASVRIVATKDENRRDVGLPPQWTEEWRSGPLAAYVVPRALPRAYRVAVGRHCASGGRAPLALLAAGTVDLQTEVLLEESLDDASRQVPPEPSDRCDPAGPAAQRRGGGTAEIVEHRPTRVRIETEADAPGYVVLTEASAPGWLATVGGQPASLLTANFAFRAVPVPAGRQVVELRYEAPGFRVGLAITVLSLVLAGALLAARTIRLGSWYRASTRSRGAQVVGLVLLTSLAATLIGFAPHPTF